MTGVRPQDRLAWHRQLTGDHGLSHIAIHVGLTISNYFNNGSGECFVGIERLAREAGVHGETARKAVSTLANRGHLRVKRGGGRGLANTYGMVVREPYPLPENTSRGAGVSEPIPQPTEPKNPSRSAGPTLKKRTLRKSNGFAMKKKASQPQPRTASAAPVAELGSNGRAVLKIGSPQWEAWLHYHQAIGDNGRASLMRHMADSSRSGEWEETTEWPPSHVAPRDHGSRTESGRR